MWRRWGRSSFRNAGTRPVSRCSPTSLARRLGSGAHRQEETRTAVGRGPDVSEHRESPVPSRDLTTTGRRTAGWGASVSALGLTCSRRTLITGAIALGLVVTLGYGLVPLKSLAASSRSEEVGELLRNRMEATEAPPRITVGDEVVHASVMLPLFYERRAYQPAWSGDTGLSRHVEALLGAIRGADEQGLRPSDYHLVPIESALVEMRRNEERQAPLDLRGLADLDLLLTDAFLVYGSHLLEGRVNPETIDPEWSADRREADLAEVLQDALDSGRVGEALKGLLPPHAGYGRLREALARYRNLAATGGWTAVADGSVMRKGYRGERAAALRARLVCTGDLDRAAGAARDSLDDAVEGAVRAFQRRHGLFVDGVVGPRTQAALNVPAEERVREIELNLERWRWLPQDLGQRCIVVNIANFGLEVWEDHVVVLAMRVVVGRQYRPTPVFSSKITYLVFNPTWHVPAFIATQDLLPMIRDNPDYLREQRMKVFEDWGGERREVDPGTVDWGEMTSQNFRYRLRQEPGANNALGRVKFMFPNRFDVYLHDTPSKYLFVQTDRSFSSGCIRIEKPIELAEYVLGRGQRLTRRRILAAIDRGVEQSVRLPQPIPIHVLYWTAWAEDDGTVHFRKDIYGRDRRLGEALCGAAHPGGPVLGQHTKERG